MERKITALEMTSLRIEIDAVTSDLQLDPWELPRQSQEVPTIAA
jgi:hypothetical protein